MIFMHSYKCPLYNHQSDSCYFGQNRFKIGQSLQQQEKFPCANGCVCEK